MTAISFPMQMNTYGYQGHLPNKRLYQRDLPREETEQVKEMTKANRSNLGKHVDVSV